MIVSQKTLTPRPHSSNKSPIQGWSGEDASEKGTIVANGISKDDTFHNNSGENAEGGKEVNDVEKETENSRTNAIENADKIQGNEKDNKDTEAENIDNEKEINETKDIKGNDDNTGKDNVENKETADIDDLVVVTVQKNEDGGEEIDLKEEIKGNTDDEKRVQKTEDPFEEAEDKDQTDVKSEDYLGN